MAETTLETFAEGIASTLGRGTDPLLINLIKRRVLHFRQLLLKRDYQSSRIFYQSAIQAFDIGLTETTKDGSRVYISDVLPTPMLLKGRQEPFISVTNSLLDTRRRVFGWVTPEEFNYLEYRKFSKPSDYYTFENGRIITLSPRALRVRALWENPIEVANFSSEQDLKLGCKTKTLEGNCFYNGDLVLEETMAASILSFFGNDKALKEEVQTEQGKEQDD